MGSAREEVKNKNGLFNDIDQKGGGVSCRNHYFLRLRNSDMTLRKVGVYFKTEF